MTLTLYRLTMTTHAPTRARRAWILAAPHANPIQFGIQVANLLKPGEGIANIDVVKEYDLAQTPMLMLEGDDEAGFWRAHTHPWRTQ